MIQSKKTVSILGGSLGGVIAAAELSKAGVAVTIYEKGSEIGGLYKTVTTPFGEQELGMHVLYVSLAQLKTINEIFPHDDIRILEGVEVDIGGALAGGRVRWNSHYPSTLLHPQRDEILEQILNRSKISTSNSDAEQEVLARFGSIAGTGVVLPILERL